MTSGSNISIGKFNHIFNSLYEQMNGYRYFWVIVEVLIQKETSYLVLYMSLERKDLDLVIIKRLVP